jgi:signal transduction histidine kinase
LDIGLISLGVALSGGSESRYSLLLFLVVVFAAYFYSIADTILVTLLTIIVFCLPLVYSAHSPGWVGPLYACAAGVMILVSAVTKQTVLRVEAERARRDHLEAERDQLFAAEMTRVADLELKNRQLERILEMGNTIRLQVGLDSMLEKIASAIGESAEFNAVVIRLFDPASGAAICRAVYGIERDLVELPTPPGLIESLMSERFRISRSYLVELDPATLEDPDKKPYLLVRSSDQPVAGNWGPEHSLIVPLETREHGLIGIISIDEPANGRIPSVDTIQTLEIFANLAATAIDNARLLEEAGQAQALRDLDRLKSEFLATISHDLRTPLTVIKGSVDLLDSHSFDLQPTQRSLVEAIGRNTRRLMDMVEQLLEMIQLQEGRTVLHLTEGDLREILAETAAALTVAATSRGQTIEVSRGDGPLFLSFDKRRIQQVATNLIGNACKYGPESEPIQVSADVSPNEVVVSVRDHGQPIGPEERKRIFEKFYRSEISMSRAGGSGLGLAICRSLIELHGGRIWVDSDASGNTFRFTLPLPRADA